jgi:putative peptide zinc metalloprotease protein
MWMVRPLMTKKAFYIYLFLLIFAMINVLQQWHTFTSYVRNALSWEGALYLFFALAISKSIHECGHAYTAKSFGLKVPTIGLMWMMIFGFLYTDTTESWKLESRKQRIAIGSAGVLAEMQLAIIATLLWTVLPDGGVRYACFYLGTAAWVATLAINLSPFLRWDGYWVLSDLVGIQNLRERAGKICSWFFGKMVMGFNDEIPVQLPKRQIRFCIIFSILAWFYRIGIFLGIGLLIFSRVFKLLGIFILFTMITALVLGPIIEALKEWFQRRADYKWNKYSATSFGIILFILLLLFIPWRSSIQVPAVIAPQQHIEVFAGVEGQVLSVPEHGSWLQRGDQLFSMRNPKLEYDVASRKNSIEYYQLSLQRTGSRNLLESRALDQERLQEANGRYKRALRDLQKLNALAPYEGQVIWVNKVAKQGGWVSPTDAILTFANTAKKEIYAYIGEYDLQRLYLEGDVIFYPENTYFKPLIGRISGVDSANINSLDYDILAKRHGGPIAIQIDPDTGQLKPIDPLYLVRITLNEDQSENFPILIRGRTILKGEKKSFVSRFVDTLVGTIIRESGF